MNHNIYLAGPIAGLSYGEASQWRLNARKLILQNWEFNPKPIIVDPFDLPGIREMVYHRGGSLPTHESTWTSQIFHFDTQAVLEATAILVGLPASSTYASFGTGFELGMIYHRILRDSIPIPVVLYTERVQPIHTFIDALNWPVFTSLETATKVLATNLSKLDY